LWGGRRPSRGAEKSTVAPLQDFGEFPPPARLSMASHMIKPRWRASDIIEPTETVAHSTVRQPEPGVAPPDLRLRRVRSYYLVLIPNSPAKMGAGHRARVWVNRVRKNWSCSRIRACGSVPIIAR
jgi:hypothetical protein